MHRFFYCLLLGCFLCINVDSKPPEVFPGFQVQALDPTEDLLSGMLWTEEGLIVCDRGAGNLLLFKDDASINILVDGLDTPVDVELYEGNWIILQEEEGSLLSIDVKTHARRIIADDFIHPTAFTIDNNDKAYVTDFVTGVLTQVDLDSGEKQEFNIEFDKPSDILFVPPNTLVVADQVELDGKGGMVYSLDTSGEILSTEHRIVDPTGLALSPSEEVYVSTFFLQGPPMGPVRDEPTGGIVSLQARGRPREIISGLLGPTSVEINPAGDIYVLEEPTDSIYRYTESGNRSSLLEGFSSIHKAVRNSHGEIIAIEDSPIERLSFRDSKNHHHTWMWPEIGNWEKSCLAIDGFDYVYLSDPFFSRIEVLNPEGEKVSNFNRINPVHMAGSPQGGIYVLSNAKNQWLITRLQIDQKSQEVHFDLGSQVVDIFVKKEDQLVCALTDGSVMRYSFESQAKTSLIPSAEDRYYLSLAPDSSEDEAMWLMDNKNTIYYWRADQEMERVANTSEAGTLLSDEEGVLFLSESGKRYVITPKPSLIRNWGHY